MNPITKALDEIKFSIPAEILNYVFITQKLAECGNIVSLDARIRDSVLENRVLVDLDIHGGTQALISLDTPVRIEYVDPYTVIYHIPDEVTQNRPIVQVYSVHFGVLGYQSTGMALHYTESVLSAETRGVLDSALRTPAAVTSYLNIIAHNVVAARFVYIPYKTAFMRVRLGNDNALSHIRPQAIPFFAELCILAVKAFIYNEMVIKLGQAYLSGGQELGIFRELIMNWADADEMYREKLRRWKKISVLNDPEAHRHHIRTIVGRP